MPPKKDQQVANPTPTQVPANADLASETAAAPEKAPAFAMESNIKISFNYGDMIVKMLGAITEDLTRADIQKIVNYLQQISTENKTAEEQKATSAESTSVSEYDYENVESEVSSREADTSEFLQISARAHDTNSEVEKLALGVACLTEMLNKTLRRLKITESDDLRSNEPFVNPPCEFDLEKTTNIEDDVVLPSGRTLNMSNCISVLDASSWTYSNYERDAKRLVRHIFTQVADKDTFFPAYSTSSKSNKYIPLGNAFFKTVTNFVIAGFGQSSSSSLQTDTTRLVRKVIGNLLRRKRSQLDEKTRTELAEELKAQLEACKYAPQRVMLNFE